MAREFYYMTPEQRQALGYKLIKRHIDFGDDWGEGLWLFSDIWQNDKGSCYEVYDPASFAWLKNVFGKQLMEGG